MGTEQSASELMDLFFEDGIQKISREINLLIINLRATNQSVYTHDYSNDLNSLCTFNNDFRLIHIPVPNKQQELINDWYVNFFLSMCNSIFYIVVIVGLSLIAIPRLYMILTPTLHYFLFWYSQCFKTSTIDIKKTIIVLKRKLH